MTGVLIILGIVLVAAVGGVMLHAAAHRFGRSKQRAMERHPAPRGRIGRVSDFEDGPRR
jgi:hypothetical protein